MRVASSSAAGRLLWEKPRITFLLYVKLLTTFSWLHFFILSPPPKNVAAIFHLTRLAPVLLIRENLPMEIEEKVHTHTLEARRRASIINYIHTPLDLHICNA